MWKSKVSPTLPQKADYLQKVNSKVAPTFHANFPPKADYSQEVKSKVSPTLPPNFPADADRLQQVEYLREIVKITRDHRTTFADNYDRDRVRTQANIDAAIMSFNFAYVELFRQLEDDLTRLYIDTMNQYHQDEINYLL